MSRKKDKILYVQTSGVDTPERLYSPFVLGMSAAAMGVEASVFFMIKGVTVVKNGEAEKVQMGTFPDLKSIIDQAVSAGVKLYVCEQSTQLFGMSRGDFIPEAKIVGAATLTDLSLDANVVMTF
ncbi:MAG: DsrE family protein [Candidatus Krumholzibacteria bacterium]|nr:DsrE family protein [Candidatus Krumholzibacteria bacterium]